MRIAAIFKNCALFLRLGRYAAKQSMGRHADWFILSIIMLILITFMTIHYVPFVAGFSIITIILSANLFPSESANHALELSFIAEDSLAGSMRKKFFALFLFIASLMSMTIAMMIPVFSIVMLLLQLVSPEESRHFPLPFSQLACYLVQAVIPILFIQSLTVLLSLSLKTGSRTILVMIVAIAAHSIVPVNFDPLFNAVPSPEELLAPTWIYDLLANRITLLLPTFGCIYLMSTRLRKVEPFLR